MPELATRHLTVSTYDGVTTVILDNPARHNALNREMLIGLTKVMSEVESDPDIRVVVLRGAGGRAFASGVDLGELNGRPADLRSLYTRMLRTVRASSRPVISLIDGYCLGGGLELALATDLRHCSDRSQFGIPAASLGIAYVDTAPLAAVIGPSRAAELLFTGRTIDAHRALRIGLVDEVHSETEVDAAVQGLAQCIAGKAPLAVRAMKLALREGEKPEAARDSALLDRLARTCAESDDLVEGLSARREKRTPNFKGR